jgi:hypothetical protein
VAINHLFKQKLPLPAALTGAINVRASAIGLPTGVRINGGFIGGRPKQSGTFTISVKFQGKMFTTGTKGKRTATTVQATQHYTLTVGP